MCHSNVSINVFNNRTITLKESTLYVREHQETHSSSLVMEQ